MQMKKTMNDFRSKCPSEEVLLEFSRLNLEETEHKRILSHLERCDACLYEYGVINDYLGAENEAILELKAFEKKRPGVSHDGFGYFLRKWKSFVAVSASILIVGFSIHFILNRGPERQRSPAPRLEIISPSHSTLSFTELVFLWKDVSADYYTVEIFDETGEMVGSSGFISTISFKPDEALKSKFKGESSYFWMVSAYFSDGKKLESKLMRFNLRENN